MMLLSCLLDCIVSDRRSAVISLKKKNNWLLSRFLSLNLYNLQCVLVMFSFLCVCLGFVALIGSVGLQFHQIWKNFGYFLSFLYPTLIYLLAFQFTCMLGCSKLTHSLLKRYTFSHSSFFVFSFG